MAVEIKMPKMSQTTEEVLLMKWLVSEGDQVEKGQALCEVETDKTIMPVESFAGGTVLKFLAEPDTVVSAGDVIALVGEAGEKVDADSIKPAASITDTASKAAATETEPASARAEGIKATPLVRNIARKRNVDLTQVKGTGARGLITKKDVESFLASGGDAGGALVDVVVDSAAAAGPPAAGSPAGISLIQQQVAEHLTRSKREVPHFYIRSEMFTDRLTARRNGNLLPDGKRISITAYFIHALAGALRKRPQFNASFREGRVIPFPGIHIGCAVSAGEALLVPVIRDADIKSLETIDEEVRRLAAEARTGKLGHVDTMGGTFTVTNLGMYPVDEFYAIVNPPQAGILAIGRMKNTMHVNADKTISIRSVCSVTGSFDHRVAGGAQAGELFAEIQKYLEEL